MGYASTPGIPSLHPGPTALIARTCRCGTPTAHTRSCTGQWLYLHQCRTTPYKCVRELTVLGCQFEAVSPERVLQLPLRQAAVAVRQRVPPPPPLQADLRTHAHQQGTGRRERRRMITVGECGRVGECKLHRVPQPPPLQANLVKYINRPTEIVACKAQECLSCQPGVRLGGEGGDKGDALWSGVSGPTAVAKRRTADGSGACEASGCATGDVERVAEEGAGLAAGDQRPLSAVLSQCVRLPPQPTACA